MELEEEEFVTLLFNEKKWEFVLPVAKDTVCTRLGIRDFVLELSNRPATIGLNAIKKNKIYKIVEVGGICI